MKTILIFLAAIILLFFALGKREITIELGMSKQQVIDAMASLKAKDSGNNMSVRGTPPKNWVWYSERYKLFFETNYQKNKLSELKIWDFNKLTGGRYHFYLEHLEMKKVIISKFTRSFSGEIVTVHNKGILK